MFWRASIIIPSKKQRYATGSQKVEISPLVKQRNGVTAAQDEKEREKKRDRR